MTRLQTIACTLGLIFTTSHAAVIQLHLYELDTTTAPADSVGSADFTGVSFGSEIDVETTSPSPVSTTYTSFTTERSGFFGADLSSVPTDNFAMELWTRTSDISQNVNVFQTGGTNVGRLKFTIINGNWAASYDNVDWIGANGGSQQPATANEWTHLAVIRENGVSTFYINGVAQTGTTTATPTFGTSAHLAVESGGLDGYRGDIDNIRIFSFDPLVDDPVASLRVPEPSSAMLLTLAGPIAALRRRQ